MVDGPPSAYPRALASRLTALHDQQVAWDTLSWNSLPKFPIRHGAWELLGGMLATTEQAFAGTNVFMRRLPSVHRHIKLADWSFQLDYPILDFTMDASQGLVITLRELSYATFMLRKINPE
jgi:hypothetical protein